MSGIQAINLEEGDELVGVALVTDESTEVLLATRAGQLVRFPLAEVRPMGRATYGVIGVRLSHAKDDRVVAMAPVSPKFPTLLSLTSRPGTESAARPRITARRSGGPKGSGRSVPGAGTVRSSRSSRRRTPPSSS